MTTGAGLFTRRRLLVSAAAAASVAVAGLATAASVLPGAKGLSIQGMEDERLWPPTRLDAALNDAQALGVEWLRVGIAWAWIQPNGARDWDFSFPDRIVQKLAARGIGVLIQLIVPLPRWAVSLGESRLGLPLSSAQQFGVFAERMASRYAPSGVRHWEILNEYNGRFDARNYGPVLRAAYEGIHAANPSATVVLGGLMTTDSTSLDGPAGFIEALYQNGYGRHFDAVAVHPYTWSLPLDGPGTNWSEMWRGPASVRGVLRSHGDMGRRIWITEMGCPTFDPKDPTRSEEQQVAYLEQAYALARSYDWAGPLFWYSYRDAGFARTTAENFYGLLRYDLHPKLGYSAYRRIAST